MLISISNKHRPPNRRTSGGRGVSVLCPRQLGEGGLRHRRELCISRSNLKVAIPVNFVGKASRQLAHSVVIGLGQTGFELTGTVAVNAQDRQAFDSAVNSRPYGCPRD
jgi:hypothetical protein